MRHLLQIGAVEDASEVLGRPYALTGTVVKGQQLGRSLGYPTANLAALPRQIVPADGIYAVDVTLEDGRIYRGACSIGNRPTIESAGRAIETFLINFDGNLYGMQQSLSFLKRLRVEVKFESLTALKVQMALDVEEASRAEPNPWLLL